MPDFFEPFLNLAQKYRLFIAMFILFDKKYAIFFDHCIFLSE
jgi:hypothetical protein